eukprot:ctg_1779.g510
MFRSEAVGRSVGRGVVVSESVEHGPSVYRLTHPSVAYRDRRECLVADRRRRVTTVFAGADSALIQRWQGRHRGVPPDAGVGSVGAVSAGVAVCAAVGATALPLGGADAGIGRHISWAAAVSVRVPAAGAVLFYGHAAHRSRRLRAGAPVAVECGVAGVSARQPDPALVVSHGVALSEGVRAGLLCHRNPLLARAAEGNDNHGGGGGGGDDDDDDVAYADFTHLQRDADERCGRVNRTSAAPPIPSEAHGRAKARPHRSVSLLISSASVWSALATCMPAAHLLRALSHIASTDRYVERTVIVGDAAEDIAWEVEHWGRRVSTNETSATGDEDEVVLVLAHEACGDDTRLMHGVLTGVHRMVCRASACGADAGPEHSGRSVTWVVLPSRLAHMEDALRQWDRLQPPPREKASDGNETVTLERQRWTCCAVTDGRGGEGVPETPRPDAPPSAMMSLPATLTLDALLQFRACGRQALEIVGDPVTTSALYAALSVCMRCIRRSDILLDGYGMQEAGVTR